MDGKVIRIILHRCDEKPKSLATANHAPTETCDHHLFIKTGADIGRNYANCVENQCETVLKLEIPDDYSPEPEVTWRQDSTDSFDHLGLPINTAEFKTEFPENYGNDDFENQLEALLTAEPEDYQPTQTLTFYSAIGSGEVPKLDINIKVEKCQEEQRQLEDPLALSFEDTTTMTPAPSHVKCKIEGTNEKSNLRVFDPLEETPCEQFNDPLYVPVVAIKCKICGVELKTSLGLRKHEISVHGYNRNSHVMSRGDVHKRITEMCPICRKFLVGDKNKVRRHLKAVHKLSNEEYLEMIPRKLRNKRVVEKFKELDDPLSMNIPKGQGHSSNTSLSCPICLKIFNARIKLHRHMRSVHKLPQHRIRYPKTAPMTFVCPICQETFATIKNIRLHWRDVHKLGRNRRGQLYAQHFKQSVNESSASFTCPICQKVLAHKYNMKRHFLKVHELCEQECRLIETSIPNVNGIFPCPLCNKMLAHDRNLKRHLQITHKLTSEQAMTECRRIKGELEECERLKEVFEWTEKTNNLITNICNNVKSEADEIGCDQPEYYSSDMTAIDPLSI